MAEDSSGSTPRIPKWARFEAVFRSAVNHPDPLGLEFQAEFTAPSGKTRLVDGFYDGESCWRLRFSPDETGDWSFQTRCREGRDAGLHQRSGQFACVAPVGADRFSQHGPIQLSADRHSLVHADGTPFFWLADTAWNGALLSTDAEWDLYLKERARQKFSAVQWVATQWRAAPDGDREKRVAYWGRDTITINPKFFQRLDVKVEAMNRAGLLSAPVMLWAINGGGYPQVNPGVSLPEDQAVRLARYMVARWQASDVVWILAGDGDYRGAKAERWKRIGRAVFGDRPHAPVTLHPGGMQWIFEEFAGESWWDICGHQSGHGDDDRTLRWMQEGPLTRDWKRAPARPFLNLEPPYEDHLAYQSRKRIPPLNVRRAVYWTLLNAPTAGISYGGHGVWGWDDGTHPPTDHPTTGIPQPWSQALKLPAAEQMAQVARLFGSLDFGRLRPAPEMLAAQPGQAAPERYLAAARTEAGDLAVIYVPVDRVIEVKLKSIPPNVSTSWFNPRTGESATVVAVVNADSVQFATPAEGDWVLVLKSEKK